MHTVFITFLPWSFFTRIPVRGWNCFTICTGVLLARMLSVPWYPLILRTCVLPWFEEKTTIFRKMHSSTSYLKNYFGQHELDFGNHVLDWIPNNAPVVRALCKLEYSVAALEKPFFCCHDYFHCFWYLYSHDFVITFRKPFLMFFSWKRLSLTSWIIFYIGYEN